jgi:hypothetical protein
MMPQQTNHFNHWSVYFNQPQTPKKRKNTEGVQLIEEKQPMVE